MKTWILPAGMTDGWSALRMVNRPSPEVGPNQVRIRLLAWSTNFRDIMVAGGTYGPVNRDIVPLSDGAGEIVAIGEGVSRWQVGDRVAGIFSQTWLSGRISAAAQASSLGMQIDGVLAEEVVLGEQGIVRIPEHMSFEQAACLPCAAVTAWNALFEVARIQPGDKVLVLGTGGVSLFALQLAKAAGAWVMTTSSSDEKLQRTQELGADAVINYRTTPDWGVEALKATGGIGADAVVEVGGPGTLPNSLAALAPGGTVALIGVLTGREGQVNPLPLVPKAAKIQGIYVGSREMFERMIRAMQEAKLVPVIDRRFSFDEAPQAYKYQMSAGHFGKVVITSD